jgi:hypothetical protein
MTDYLEEIERLQHEATANKLEALMLQDQMNEWIKCCDMFFHVAGKSHDESWEQFTKAADVYQRLKVQHMATT